MATSEHYDAIVSGSGQGGTLSMELANERMRAVLVEREHVGGTCINEGCTPESLNNLFMAMDNT